jgi:hypothetical protein
MKEIKRKTTYSRTVTKRNGCNKDGKLAKSELKGLSKMTLQKSTQTKTVFLSPEELKKRPNLKDLDLMTKNNLR